MTALVLDWRLDGFVLVHDELDARWMPTGPAHVFDPQRFVWVTDTRPARSLAEATTNAIELLFTLDTQEAA